MKPQLISTLLLLTSFNLVAKDTLSVKSTIKQVTVFLKGAQVTRSGTVTSNAGVTYLKFTKLSPELDKQSIKVEAGNRVTLLSVNHQINFLEEQTKEKSITLLESRKERLIDSIQLEKNNQAIYQLEEEMLLANKSIAGQEKGVLVTELKAAANFYRERLQNIRQHKMDAAKKIKLHDKFIKKIDKQLKELRSNRNLSTSEVIVAINTKQPGSIDLGISYFVENAGWYPTYDLRVENINNPVGLTYKANVNQLSGEDWNDVNLTISSADPKESAERPYLAPWYLNFESRYSYRKPAIYGSSNSNIGAISGTVADQNGPLPYANIIVKGTTIGTTTDIDGNYSLSIPQGASSIVVSYTGYTTQEFSIGNSPILNAVLSEGVILEEAVVTAMSSTVMGVSSYNRNDMRVNDSDFEFDRKTKEKRGQDYYVDGVKVQQYKIPLTETTIHQTSFEIEIANPYTIPNDGKQYTVEMVKYALPATYEYYCAPKLSTDAFLTANVVGWEDYNLLAGETSLFFEDTYIGKAVLDTDHAEDTLQVSLGRDKNVSITRNSLKEFNSKKLVSTKKKVERAWEVVVKNNKAESIDITIDDQFPVSTSKEILVEHLDTNTADFDPTTGKLTWHKTITKGSTEKMQMRYSVKYPKGRIIYLE